MARAFLHWNTTPYASNGTIRGSFNTYDDPNPPTDGLLSLVVHHSRGSYVMRGFNEVPAESLMMFVDHEAPLNEPVRIEVWFDGIPSAGVHVLTVAADSPLISDPLRGGHVPVTIQKWDERLYARAGKAVEVSDSRFPVIIGGFERGATSSISLIHNQSPDSALQLESMLQESSLLRVRPSCPSMPAAWVSARDRRRSRFSKRPDSVYVDTIDLLHTAMPSPDMEAIGNTLQDLHETEPGTLADIAARWSQLRWIDSEDLTA